MVVRIHPGQSHPRSPRRVVAVTPRRHPVPLLAAGTLLIALGAAGAAGQAPDSAARVQRAHDAQGRFERDRIRWLDPDRGGSGGPCEVTLGRMCVRLAETADWWPSPDPPELAAARERLLRDLADAASAAPGDEWILGQRVVYLGEAGRWDEARRVAAACGGVPHWWCAALEGLALHRLGRYVSAEEHFRRALAGMPAAERARWSDVTPLLDGDGRDARAEASGAGGGDGAAAAERWWALADPLHLVEGNDRLTEHWARHTVARTREGARNPYGMSWGSDLAELLVRYGVEAGWARRLPPSGSIGIPTAAVGHHAPRSRAFLPPPAAWTDPASTPAEAWNPGSRRTPSAMYAPAYAPVFLPAPAQLSVSRRGDRIVVRAGVDLPADTTWHSGHGHPPLDRPAALRRGGVVQGLFLDPARGGAGDGPQGEGGSFAVVRRDSAGGALSLEAPAGDWVVSVEVLAPERGLAGRYRRGLRSPPVPVDVPTLSDLMVARPVGPPPDGIEAFLATLGAVPAPAPGETLRVGWEVSGLGWLGPEEVAYRLELVEPEGGVLTRVGRWLRLVGEPEGVGLDWREPGPRAPGVVFRAVDLELPVGLEEGGYRLRLTLSTRGRTPVVAERPVRVRRAGDEGGVPR